MKKHISAHYINEKSSPIKNLLSIVDDDSKDSDNITEQLSDNMKREVAFAFAVIAKELGVSIPDV